MNEAGRDSHLQGATAMHQPPACPRPSGGVQLRPQREEAAVGGSVMHLDLHARSPWLLLLIPPPLRSTQGNDNEGVGENQNYGMERGAGGLLVNIRS